MNDGIGFGVVSSFQVRILGCGSSGGVPRLGGGWGRCDPSNSKNRRRRCSILLTKGEAGALSHVLVDASPDMREQLLEAGVNHLDALVMTHTHADHVHGIDDIRPLVIHNRKPLDVYADKASSEKLLSSFGYVFHDDLQGFYPAIAQLVSIEAYQSFVLGGAGGRFKITPFCVEHGPINALGFRVADFAYIPDVSSIPEASEALLQNLDCLVIDALRYKPHGSHFCFDEALSWIKRLSPRRAVLTNMHPDLDYDEVNAATDGYIEPAFDGMVLTFD